MERTRESKRSSMASSTAAGNGFHRRSRHRTIALRDSSEDGVSKRGRSKRRRSSHSRRDEGDEHSTEESVGNEQDDDVVLQDAGASGTRTAANTTSSTSFAASDQILRRSFAAAPLKVANEMIGVAVPRKARSASVKRSHENCVSASGGGGGGERNFRQRSNSPVEPASPSSSSVSVKKKMKAIEDASDTLKSSSSEIEIEIAELLYGLMTSKNSSSKDAEKKKVEECNSSCALIPCNSTTAELVRTQSEQRASVDCHDGNAAVHENGSSEAPKEDIGEDKKNSGDGFGVAADGRSISLARESSSRTGLDVEKQDSASARGIPAVPGANGQRVCKFEIDLMAPPPMILSPEGDDLSKGDFTSETKALALDLEMKSEDIRTKVEGQEERPVKKEKTADEIEEAKMVTIKHRSDVLKHELEKPNNDTDIRTNNRLEEQERNKEPHTQSSNPKVEKTAQSSSVPLLTAVSGRPCSLSSIGCTTPLETVVKTDKTAGSSSTFEHVKFVLSQAQLKRCATHHYIARNIFLHQQLTKMNPLLPPAIGSGSLCGTKSNNINCVPSAESTVIGKQSQKHLPGVNQNAAQEKGLAATSDPSLTAIKSSNNANPMDSMQRMQLVLQQGPHPGSTGNLVHGPTFLFPLGQHQTSVATATSQVGGVNSTISASSYNKSHSSAARSLATSSTLPPVAGSMSFSYPHFSTNDNPYVTIVQNNGYSFPFSTSVGANAAIRGASPAQATQILNRPFYSSQTIHPLQHPPQHPHSQVLVQPSYLSASTSSSSSSHKPSQGAQVDGNSILTSPIMQSQQSQKQQTSLSRPLKHETQMGGDNASSVTNRKSYPQKNVHGQNFTIPVQPVNLSFMSPAISDNGGKSGNFGDKQQQALKGGVETLPSQAFAISFAGYNGTNGPSNLNFSSMAQNPVIFQSLPDIAWQGYQAPGTPHTTQQRAYSITEGKSGSNSSHRDDEKKTTHGKSSTNNGPTTLVFDNSSKNLNFLLSPTSGNWPSCSIASTAVTGVPLSSNASSSQEPSQLLHLHKQHGVQQQQPAMATRYKASSTNITSATQFANNSPVLSQTQCKSSNQASNSRSSGRTMDSYAHHTPIITSNTPNLRSFSQEQGRVSQGRMQISFGGDYATPLPPQGQQLLNNNRSLCTTVAGTPLNGGNLKPNPEGRKASSSVNTSQSQQTENSSAGSGQKSSPVCGRNVPSILSSCPSQLSELKY